MVEGSSITLEFKVAIDSDGTIDSVANDNEPYFTFTSARLDLEYPLAFQSRYPEFPYNYYYTIENVDRLQEGLYTAMATSFIGMYII